jgi:HPr kinase/phosphorylase
MSDKSISVEQFYDETRRRLQLHLVTSEAGFFKTIGNEDIHRPGLALAGFVELFTYDRIQVLGNTEIRFLNSLSSRKRREALERLLLYDIPCFIITSGNAVPRELIEIAIKGYMPVFYTPLKTTNLVHQLSTYLDSKFAPKTSVHGSLVDVYGIGLLITGRSGIGKSEITLDLVERGHRLVADDMVMITKKGEDVLMGEGREMAEHHLEIRGLGFIDIRRMFGIRGIRIQKRVEVEVHLVDWDNSVHYDRTGLEEVNATYLDVDIPKVLLPIHPGKNITVIAETIALNQILKIYGHHSAKEFNRRLIDRMKMREKAHLTRLKLSDYLEKGFRIMLNAFIITHGTMAQCVIRTVSKITGIEEGLTDFSNDGKDTDSLVQEMLAHPLAKGNQLLFLFSEFKGGSTWFAANKFSHIRGNTVVLTGVNIPMLIAF